MPRQIHIAAAVIARPDGRVLLVRKQGSALFMQPGGKIEPGEAPLAALWRELDEEVGLGGGHDAVHLGRFAAPAANEPDTIVVAEAYLVRSVADLVARAEIAEIRWVDATPPDELPLAILSRDHILPAYRKFVG